MMTLSDGRRLGYEMVGEGTPIVLVAGTGCDRRFWRLQVEEYAKRHRVITVDMRGAGQSTVALDVESYTSESMADDVAELVEALDLGPVHLAGHSLGSCIVQQFGIRHGRLARSLQLHATWAYADEWLRRAFIGTTRFAMEQGDLRQTLRTVLMWMLSPEYLESRPPGTVSDMVAHCFIDNPHLQANAGMLGHLRADEKHDTRALLGGLEMPVLVTAGEHDLLIPARYGQVVAELIPSSRYHEFRGPGSTHGANWEMVEEFNEVTSRFLDEADREVAVR